MTFTWRKNTHGTFDRTGRQRQKTQLGIQGGFKNGKHWRTTHEINPSRTMDPAHRRGHLHDHDRQPAIWLDPVRPPDQRRAWLVDRLDPGPVSYTHLRAHETD